MHTERSRSTQSKLSDQDESELRTIISLVWGNSTSDKFQKVFLAGW